MNRFELKAQTYLAKEDDLKIKEVAEKHGIEIPNDDLAIFVTKYAALEEANLNGVRLSEEAVRKFIKSLNGKLADIDHIRPYVIGSILEGWINEETKEIEIAFTMYKSVFIDEYAKALELMSEGKLSVSFELTTNPDTIENFQDGTIRLHDINFSGVGLLLNTNPAYPKAQVYQMANRLLNKVKDSNLVFASQIAEELGSQAILEIEKAETTEWNAEFINTLPNSSFAVVEPDFIEGKTDDKNCRHLSFKHADAQIDLTQLKNAFANVNNINSVTMSISTEELRKQASEELEKYRHYLENSQEGGQKADMELTEEQNQKIAELVPELSDVTTDVSDLSDEVMVIEEAKPAAPVEAQEEVVVEHTCVTTETTSDDGEVTVVTDEKTVVTKTDEDGEKEVRTDENTSKTTYTMEEMESEVAPLRANIIELSEENQLLKARIKELEDEKSAKELSEKIAAIKAELKDNPYVKDFADQDYLDEVKIEKAKILKERDDARAETEELRKQLSAKQTVVASEEKPLLVTGHETKEEKKESSKSVKKLINQLGKQ